MIRLQVRTGIKSLWMLFWFLSAGLLSKAQKDNQKPGIFYAITGKGMKDTSWLFGTFHLVNSGYLDSLPAVTAALQKTKGVVVEVVVDSSKLMNAQMMALLKEKTLADLLSKSFQDSLDKELKATLGVGLLQMNQLKPMTVTLTLSMFYLMSQNEMLKQYKGQPLDAYFADHGKKQHKQVTALETIEEQMNLLFNKTPEEEQVKQMEDFLRHKHEMIDLENRLLHEWFDQDLEGMYQTYLETMKLSVENDYLVKDRNRIWMNSLPALLNQESQFIAVGSLHLSGPDGLIHLLRERGYSVTPVK